MLVNLLKTMAMLLGIIVAINLMPTVWAIITAIIWVPTVIALLWTIKILLTIDNI